MKSETPRSDATPHNVPELAMLCRKLERELSAAIKALDELHILCETAPPDIFDWYLTDKLAEEARKNAIEILLANRAAAVSNDELCRVRKT